MGKKWCARKEGDNEQQVWHFCLQIMSGRQEVQWVREGHPGTKKQQVPGVNTSQWWLLMSWRSCQSQASRTVQLAAFFVFLRNIWSYQIRSALQLLLRRHGRKKDVCSAGENSSCAKLNSATKPTKQTACFRIISLQCVAHFKSMSTSESW